QLSTTCSGAPSTSSSHRFLSIVEIWFFLRCLSRSESVSDGRVCDRYSLIAEEEGPCVSCGGCVVYSRRGDSVSCLSGLVLEERFCLLGRSVFGERVVSGRGGVQPRIGE